MVSKLPSPIERVTVPASFAPSNWFRMEKCALSVWAEWQGVLPESVKAIVGRVLHAVREEVIRKNLGGPAHTDAVRVAVDAARSAQENYLAASADPIGVSLVEAYGARRWLQRTLELEAWARGLPKRSIAMKGPPIATKGPLRGGESTSGDCFGLGAEPLWNSTALRLRGRPDEVRLTECGEVEVTDYKTGFVIGRDGQIAPSIATQIQMYLLMAEELTGRQAHGIVQEANSTGVPWNDSLRESTRRRAFEMGQRFPPHAKLAATEAAAPGVHCSGCRLRPQCSTYLRTVPGWWRNDGEHPRPLPNDVWGRVSAVDEEQLGIRIHLEDETGRKVIVRGLSTDRCLDHVPVGATLFLFDLQSTEDALLHGRYIHPRALHERSPGPRWPSARRTRIYIGSNS